MQRRLEAGMEGRERVVREGGFYGRSVAEEEEAVGLAGCCH